MTAAGLPAAGWSEESPYPIVRVLVSKCAGHFSYYCRSRIYTHSAFKLHRSMLANSDEHNSCGCDVTPDVDGLRSR